MLVKILKEVFILVALMLSLMTIYGKLFVFKKKHPSFVSDYCATMAAILGIYELLGIILAFMVVGLTSKFILLGFALSPFVIGALVTYHTEKYWTVAQTLLFIFSVVYAIGI